MSSHRQYVNYCMVGWIRVFIICSLLYAAELVSKLYIQMHTLPVLVCVTLLNFHWQWTNIEQVGCSPPLYLDAAREQGNKGEGDQTVQNPAHHCCMFVM